MLKDYVHDKPYNFVSEGRISNRRKIVCEQHHIVYKHDSSDWLQHDSFQSEHQMNKTKFDFLCFAIQ